MKIHVKEQKLYALNALYVNMEMGIDSHSHKQTGIFDEHKVKESFAKVQ